MKVTPYTGQDWEVPQTVKLTPDMGNFTIESGREIKTNVSAKVQKSDQLLWLTDYTSEDGFGIVEVASFEEVPQWKEGRKDSKQGVFFGYLALGQEI